MEKVLSKKSFMVNTNRNSITKAKQSYSKVNTESKNNIAKETGKVKQFFENVKTWFLDFFGGKIRETFELKGQIVKRHNKPHQRSKKERNARNIARHNRHRCFV